MKKRINTRREQGRSSQKDAAKQRLIVVGGGIAGVSCAKECSLLFPGKEIVLISATESLKDVNYIE